MSPLLLRPAQILCRLLLIMRFWAPPDWAVLRRWGESEHRWAFCLRGGCGCLDGLPPGMYVLSAGQRERQMHLVLELPPGAQVRLEASPLCGMFCWENLLRRTGWTWQAAPVNAARSLVWGSPRF